MLDTKHKAPSGRVAYDFDEFAQLFGRDRTWSYRQVKAKRVRAISGYGKMMIPVSEIERILQEGIEQEAADSGEAR